MAITRRQFVTRLSALAAAAGLGGAQIEKISQAFAHWGTADGLTKPKVIWVHGAECTGCSTSVLGLLEDATSTVAPDVTLLAALTMVAKGDGAVNPSLEGTNNTMLENTVLTTETAPGVAGHGHRTLVNAGLGVDGTLAVNIADVLIDFIDLQYHETVMGMGGDLAAKWLANELNDDALDTPFVLVVEGAIQDSTSGGYWKETGDVPWCSVGAADDGSFEHSFDELVATLAARNNCAQVIAIGQCATGGGYPSAVGPGLAAGATVDALSNMTNAKGTYQYLLDAGTGAAGKVINVPGCPVNPWWFAFTVVLWMYEQAYVAVNGGGASGLVALDTQRRLTAVYGNQLHSKYCPRYPDYAARRFASKPGDTGCMKNIGCKGLYTMSSCGTHGWNGQQPANKAVTANLSAGEDVLTSSTDGSVRGGNCLTSGSPCMGCTEKGYPDRFTPFVIR